MIEKATARMKESRIEYGDGHLAVIDFGADAEADAVPVLLVHSLGNSAYTWQFVGSSFGPAVHAYAIDLPGHGHSSASARAYDDAWQAMVATSRALRLDRPLLVGHEQSSYHCSTAAVQARDDFRGVVNLGGAIYTDYERGRQVIEFGMQPSFAEMMHERFLLGVRGRGQETADELIVQLTGAVDDDWLAPNMREGIRREVERSVEHYDDGTWLHKPTTTSVQTLIGVPDERPITPGPWFYDALAVPQWVIELRNGFEVLSAQDKLYIGDHPMMRHAYLDTTAWPQYDKPEAVAALLETIALNPAGPDLAG